MRGLGRRKAMYRGQAEKPATFPPEGGVMGTCHDQTCKACDTYRSLLKLKEKSPLRCMVAEPGETQVALAGQSCETQEACQSHPGREKV